MYHQHKNLKVYKNIDDYSKDDSVVRFHLYHPNTVSFSIVYDLTHEIIRAFSTINPDNVTILHDEGYLKLSKLLRSGVINKEVYFMKFYENLGSPLIETIFRIPKNCMDNDWLVLTKLCLPSSFTLTKMD